MDYIGGAAISAGLIGGAVMGAVLYLGMAMAPRQMRMDLFYILGTLLIPRGSAASVYMVGALVHAMMSLTIGLIYAVFFLPFAEGSNLVAWGVLYGFVHWIIVGGNLELIGYIRPLMRARELQKPGAFAVNYPRVTAGGFLALHLVFGVLMGGLYTAWT